MQNQTGFNSSSTTDFSEEQLILGSGNPCRVSSNLTSENESLAPNNAFAACSQSSNIPSNFFMNSRTNIDPTEDAMQNMWDSTIPTVDNLSNSLSLMEQPDCSFVDSSNSVGSLSNPSHEPSKPYSYSFSHGLPSIMEDSTSDQYKPKSKRQRRNSLPPNNRGIKRKLSTASDVISTCNINELEHNSSNSSCDLTNSIESSDVLTTQSWTSCYSPYRKRTPSVASSEKANSLISKLFTEEEKQRYLAAKKKSQSVEPRKKLKCVGLLGPENKYFMDDVACTSSLNSAMFGDESILLKNETSLPFLDSQTNLFSKDNSPLVKSPIKSEINVISNDTCIDLISNPITKNLNFSSDLSSDALENLVHSNQQITIPLHSNVLRQNPEPVCSIPIPDSDASIEVSETNTDLKTVTPLMDNQFVESIDIGDDSKISKDIFTNVKISESLENIFSGSQSPESNQEKLTNEVPYVLVSDNVLSSEKPFVNVLPKSNEETNFDLTVVSKENNDSLPSISMENSEAIQNEYIVEENEQINYSEIETFSSEKPFINILPMNSEESNIGLTEVSDVSEEVNNCLQDISIENSEDVQQEYIIEESEHISYSEIETLSTEKTFVNVLTTNNQENNIDLTEISGVTKEVNNCLPGISSENSESKYIIEESEQTNYSKIETLSSEKPFVDELPINNEETNIDLTEISEVTKGVNNYLPSVSIENSEAIQQGYIVQENEEIYSEIKPTEKSFLDVLPTNNEETDIGSTAVPKEINCLPGISIENSEAIQQEYIIEGSEHINYSVIESLLASADFDNDGNTVYIDENGTVLNIYKYKTDSTNCDTDLKEMAYISVPSAVGHDINSTLETKETTSEDHVNSTSKMVVNKDPEIGISPESVSKSHNPQYIETSPIGFDFLELNKGILECQSRSESHKTPDIEASNVNINYLELPNTLAEGHIGDSNIPITVANLENSKNDFLPENDKIKSISGNDYCDNNEIIVVGNSLYKEGVQELDLEAVQEVPNVLQLQEPMETNCYVDDSVLEDNQTITINTGNYKNATDKSFTEELILKSSLFAEDSCVSVENIDLLPTSIPISNGEADMLAYFANLGSKKSKARKSCQSNTSLNSSCEESPRKMDNVGNSLSGMHSEMNFHVDSNNKDLSNTITSQGYDSIPHSNLITSELEATFQEGTQKSTSPSTVKKSVAKKSCGGSRRVSSEVSNSIPRSSSDSCERHNRTDSSSSAEEYERSSKRRNVDVNNSDSLAPAPPGDQWKTALKTFKKPFTVAKKSVDEKTAFKSVIQSYFGVRTALKTCGKSSSQKARNKMVDKNGSAIIISFQDKSDVEISPEELSSDEVKNSSGSWSPMKDLTLLKSTCQCSAEEVPCICSGETLQQTCEAEDSIDGNTVTCTKSVSKQYLLTPSTKLKHRTYCETHLARLRKHHCCPVCGLFCTQGTFLHCSHVQNLLGVKENHLFHQSCFIIPDIGLPPSCPHCCKFSNFNQVELSLIHTSDQQDTSQTSSTHFRRKNVLIDFENYYISMTPVNKEDTIKDKSSEKSLEKEDLHTMLMAITKEKSLSLRPTGKCLFNPIKNGDVKKVMQLIVNGVDPNHKFSTHKNNTPLHIAAFYGFVGIIHLLLQYGAKIDAVNDDLETPLLLAVQKNQMAVVKCLLFAGVQVDAKNDNGSTAFHLAAKNNFIEIAKLLFDTGRFDVNIQDDDGWTPLVWACEYNYFGLVQWLLELGADPNIQDNEGNTALHWAACSGDCEIMEKLLERGCNLTFVNERGDSALHVAARKDHHACVNLLLSKGASMDYKNKDNETPEMCCEKGFKSLKVFKRSSISTNNDKISYQQHVVYRDISRGAETYPIQAVNEVDQQEFIMEFRYITKNCYVPDISVVATIDSMEKCSCMDNCTNSCLCTKISKCWYDMDERLMPDFDMCDPPSVYECSKICHCPKTCINRVVQKGLRTPLQIFRTYDRGWGVRTLKSIPKGTFICEYIGEVVTGVEVAERADDSYLFDLESKDGNYCIDGQFYGNVARFINHSCDPNLISIRVFIEHQDKNFPRIAFFAMRSIDAFEELCFDYGTEFWIAKSHTLLCTCKSNRCKYSKDSIDETLQAYAAEKAEMLNM